MGTEKVTTQESINFGCDPEFFFKRGEDIIGAEKVIAGLHNPTIILDGVQVELNPSPNRCRANLAASIALSFRTLKAHLAKMKGISASFTSTVELDAKELDSLSDKAKVFGCAPSSNAYDSGASLHVDAAKYLRRSAGGHIHLGLDQNLITGHHKELVSILDVILGNTCVMIDRDPDAAERRKLYGRAGEFRTPKHGLEYRTLSNFWLRSYPLMSFVMGLARLSVNILSIKTKRFYIDSNWDAPADLFRRVDIDQVRQAINENDLTLAKKNWEGVREFIRERVVSNASMALEPASLDNFEYFLKKVEEKGLEYWFPEEPMEHWCKLMDGHGRGWETFLITKVAGERHKLIT